MRGKCYILGSGESINKLTIEERDYLNNYYNVLAMNKYLLFYNLIGVYPKDFFLLDTHFPAPIVLKESIKIANAKKNIRFFLGLEYKKIFKPALSDIPYSIRKRLSCLKHYKRILPLRLPNCHTEFFNFKSVNDFDNFYWANTINEDLCFYRGSLTTAINLCYIIYPGCDIYLLGVDLNTPRSFYQKELQKRPELIDTWTKNQTDKHATACKVNGKPGVDKFLPRIVERLKQDNINLYCCSKDSLLVKEGICEFKPVIGV